MSISKNGFDADRAWDYIRQTATEIALIHPGQGALNWAEANRPELMLDIATARDGIRDAVHDQDNDKIVKATGDWKAACVRLFEAYS